MSRTALLIWVFSPLLVIGALALMMDRSKGRPDPRLAEIAAARLPGQAEDSSRPQAQLDREKAETEARIAAMSKKPAAPTPAPDDAAAQPEGGLVQPESLPQGFILVVEDKTKVSSNESPIFVASSHNGWNPGDQNMKLTRRSDMRWQIVLPKPALDSKMAFKFTRGTWDMVECEESGKDIENRLLPKIDASKIPAGEKPVIELSIASWKDQHSSDPAKVALNPYHAIHVSAGTIKRVEVVGGGGVSLKRDLLVWLPPGYDDAANAQKRYPVLFMHDGQNLFEKLPNIPAEWGMDETAARLIEEKKIEPLIIVGIPHAGAARISEYSPVEVVAGQPANGTRYVEFLVNEVKPRIESLFRTKTEAFNNAVGGSSMGAIISLEAATEHPDIFGKVLAESTPMLANKRAVFTHFAKAKSWPGKVYFGMGGKEDANDAGMSEQYAASAQAFGELLKGRGFNSQTLKVVVEPDAQHNEQAWARRLPEALMFLFPADEAK